MRGVVYDAAVLVAADKNERRTWAEHRVRLELGVIPLVPAPVVAQVSRSPQQAQLSRNSRRNGRPRQQFLLRVRRPRPPAALRRFLAGCVVVALGESEAHEAGRLLGMTKTTDVVDAVVVTIAVRQKVIILTSDPDDMGRLVRASGREAAVVTV